MRKNNVKERGLEILNQLSDPGRPDIVLASANLEFADVKQNKEGDIEIEGFAITEALIESRRMIVNMDAFDHKDGFKMFNGRMLYFHNQDKEPVGEVVEYKLIKKKGLWIRARLWRENSELFKRAILEKKLQAMSIGFAIDKWEYDEKEDIVTITEARLKEISVVNIGADENALFEVLNSLNNVGLTTNFNEGDNTLSTKKPFDAEVFMSEQEKLGAKVESLQEILTGVKEAQTQANEKLISKSELAERLETFTSALDAIKADIDAVKTQKATSEHRLAYKDYRSLITDFIWLTDDDGNKLGNIAQRAYCLFQMPVDYDNMDNGFELKNLRDLHDATLLSDAMSRFKGRDRYSIQNLKLYKQLITATEAFDKDVALAMAGGNTGQGAEWVPEELSSEFNEILRTQPRLASLIPTWNMPKGGSAKFPFQNGKAVVYKGGEALVDNAEEARKTNIATGVKTFTPSVFIGALVSSEELTEDAILDMITFIRNELAIALLEGLESAVINGDDSTTHFDNTVDTIYASYNVETSGNLVLLTLVTSKIRLQLLVLMLLNWLTSLMLNRILVLLVLLRLIVFILPVSKVVPLSNRLYLKKTLLVF